MSVGRPRVERVQVACAACGKVNERRKSDVDRTKSGRVFCDADCRNQMGTKPRRGTQKSCQNCGKAMYVTPAVADRQKFCGKACHDEWQGRNRVTRGCDHCGDEYTLKPSQAWEYRNLDRARYCSKRCEGLDRIKRPLEREHNGKPARLDRFGYVWLWEPDHPGSEPYKGWIAEHRLVAEQMIGRPLTSDDEVNHINRDKADNRPENLQVLDRQAHSVITATQRQSDTQLLAEYIRRFGPLN